MSRNRSVTYRQEHDKDTRKLTQEFSWLGDLAEVSINGQRIALCHYAIHV